MLPKTTYNCVLSRSREWILRLTLAASLIVTACPTARAQQIISDIDDTFKISNIGNNPETVRRALLQESFTGMIPFYQAYAIEPIFVSGTPYFLSPVMDGFLKANAFEGASSYLRTSLNITTKDFKIKTISRLVEKSLTPLIFIGDDTEKDSEVYDVISREFPLKTLAIYIRKVTGKEIAPGQTSFSTALELAAYEWKAGRISLEDLEKVLSSFEHETRFRRIFPTFVPCPEKLDFKKILPESLQARGEKQERRIMEACKILSL